MGRSGYHYSLGTMSVFFHTAGTPPGTTVQPALEVDRGQAVANAGVSVVIMGGRYRQHAFKLLHNGSGFCWTAQLFRVRLVMQMDREEMKLEEAIKLSQACNSSTAIVPRSRPS